MNKRFVYSSLLLVLLCWLSVRTFAKNTTSNHTESGEEQHSFTEKLLDVFYDKYFGGDGNMPVSQLCNFTTKLGKCGAKVADDGHGHGHGNEKTEEKLVDNTKENGEEHHKDEKDHNEEGGKEEGHEEKGHEEEGHEEEGHEEEGHEEEGHEEGGHEEEGHEEGKCVGVYKVLKDNNYNETSSISKDVFSKLCPALYALFVKQLNKYASEEAHKGEHKLSQGEVWGYATVAITIISLSSLAVIAVIPLLNKSFYNKIMSFLVALAIGCLAGDALLHLIPHSLVPHSEHNHDEEAAEEDQQALFRSFIIFVGIYVFFIVECCMKLKLASRKKPDTRILYGAGKQQLQQIAAGNESTQLATAVEAVPEDPEKAEPTRHSINQFMMEVTSGNRRSSRQVRDSLWMAYMAAIDDNGEFQSFPEEGLSSPGVPKEHYRSNRESYAGRKIETLREEDSREDLLPQISESREKKRGSSEGSTNSKADSESHENQSNHNNNHNNQNHTGNDAAGHGHSHSHQKEIDSSTKIASLAWMVIVGDGFHNMADGLAVGAAFSASFTSGLSTAVAVFCHELPHELGDFAVLVKAGMTVKQAITYNMVSAVIAFLGMIIGILIGSNESSIVWVLALTAGMFLYISLVDMLPELCTQLAEEDFRTGLWTFFYQNLGILCGVLVMYLISLME